MSKAKTFSKTAKTFSKRANTFGTEATKFSERAKEKLGEAALLASERKSLVREH